MTTILEDQTTDTGLHQLHRYAKLYDLPEYLKTADYADVCRPSALPAAAYADPIRKKYPCHTKAACYASILYFGENKATIPEKWASKIEERLDKFAASWGISGDVAALRTKQAEYEAERLTDDDFALVWVDEEGNRQRQYKIASAAEVEVAARWLLQYRDDFSFADRSKIAERILTKAEKLAASLPDSARTELERQAGYGLYSPAEAAEHVRNRARLASNPDVRNSMNALSEKIASVPQLLLNPQMCRDLASVVDSFDRQIGLAGRYTESIPRPEEIFFSLSPSLAEKTAETVCEFANGDIYEKTALAKIALADLSDLFGQEFSDNVSDGIRTDPEKLASAANQMNQRQLATLTHLLSEAGVRPMMKRAARSFRFSHEQLEAFADAM